MAVDHPERESNVSTYCYQRVAGPDLPKLGLKRNGLSLLLVAQLRHRGSAGQAGMDFAMTTRSPFKRRRSRGDGHTAHMVNNVLIRRSAS